MCPPCRCNGAPVPQRPGVSTGGVAAQSARGIVESFCGEFRNRHGFEEAVHRAHGRLPIANFFENRESFSTAVTRINFTSPMRRDSASLRRARSRRPRRGSGAQRCVCGARSKRAEQPDAHQAEAARTDHDERHARERSVADLAQRREACKSRVKRRASPPLRKLARAESNVRHILMRSTSVFLPERY